MVKDYSELMMERILTVAELALAGNKNKPLEYNEWYKKYLEAYRAKHLGSTPSNHMLGKFYDAYLEKFKNKELQGELDETSSIGGGGDGGGYLTPGAFSGGRESDKKKLKKNAENSGYTIVGKD